MTHPANLYKKTVHVRATWAKRCNKVLYISTEVDPLFPTIGVESKEGRKYLWHKTRHAFQLIYDEYLHEADWFIKADDDTYLILENLRYLLAAYDSTQPIYFGHKFKKPIVSQGYMSGGGGYAISKAGVKQLVEIAYKDDRLCNPAIKPGGAEDIILGQCLQNVGVIAGDSRDSLGRDRFHPVCPFKQLNPDSKIPWWITEYAFYENAQVGSLKY